MTFRQSHQKSFSFRLLLAGLSGVMLAISFANFDITWCAFLALTPLILAARASSRSREAFLLGTISYTITWLINVPWVINVMSKYGGLPKVVGVLIFVAMAVYLGTFGGLFALLIHSLRLGSRPVPWILAAVAWTTVEYVRTYVFFSGFPWNLSATTLIDLAPLVQIGRIVGPYFIGTLVAIPSAWLAWLIAASAKWRERVVATAAVVGIFGLWLATGAWLLSRQRATFEHGPSATAALLQPNISQQMRWTSSNLPELFLKMEDMTSTAINEGANVVIWPESSIPLTYATTPYFRETIESLSHRRNVDIILGSVAEDPNDPTRLWNAAYLASGGETKGRYDKMRLVPFGEYVPWRKGLFFARKLVRAVGEFQFGTNDHPLAGKFRYGPAICYEVVFPQVTATQVRNGADVLVTITNDDWFDRSSAPRQHLNMARLRAVEADRYLLRAATTGISALVDPSGEILQSLDLDQEGIILGRFWARQSRTPYVRFGDWYAILCVVVTAAALVVRRKASIK